MVDGFTYGVDNDVSLAIALLVSNMHFGLPQSKIYAWRFAVRYHSDRPQAEHRVTG